MGNKIHTGFGVSLIRKGKNDYDIENEIAKERGREVQKEYDEAQNR